MSSANRDYVALLEFAVLTPGEVAGEDVVGGMARIYVYAAGESDARLKIQAALAVDGFSLVEYEWIVVDEDVEWENEGDEEAMMCRTQAREGKVVYGRLDVWGRDAMD